MGVSYLCSITHTCTHNMFTNLHPGNISVNEYVLPLRIIRKLYIGPSIGILDYP